MEVCREQTRHDPNSRKKSSGYFADAGLSRWRSGDTAHQIELATPARFSIAVRFTLTNRPAAIGFVESRTKERRGP